MKNADVTWFIIAILLQKVIGKCRYVFRSTEKFSGNFSSPHFPDIYPPDTDCVYSFLGQQNEGVKIQFQHFELEEPFIKGCLKDYIDITTTNTVEIKELIGRFCGIKVQNDIFSMQPTVEIHFITNHVIEHQGFFGTFEFFNEKNIGPPKSKGKHKDCGGIVTGNGGTIESPGYPNMFPANVDCKWLIRVDYNKHIHIRVLKLQLLGTIANCDKAMVGIYDGYSSQTTLRQHPSMRHFCGDIKYYKSMDDKTAVSYRNRLVIRFNTSFGGENIHYDYVGFQLAWTAVEFKDQGECKSFTCKNSHYCAGYSAACTNSHEFCIDKSLVCNGIPNCSDSDTSDEDNCNDKTLFYGIISGSIGLVLVIIIACVTRFQCKKKLSTQKDQDHHSLQLRQLDRSPSFTSRQVPNSFSCSSGKYVENNKFVHYNNSYKHFSHCALNSDNDRNVANI